MEKRTPSFSLNILLLISCSSDSYQLIHVSKNGLKYELNFFVNTFQTEELSLSGEKFGQMVIFLYLWGFYSKSLSHSIILTQGHIAKYFLSQENIIIFDLTCTIRKTCPASSKKV